MQQFFIISFLCFISQASPGQKQKNILLSQNLAENAQQMNVKMGTQWMGKIWKFSFGDYAVESSKNGWQTTNSKSNFWNTKTQSISKQKFSFVLSQKKTASATVNAATKVTLEEFHSFQVSPVFSFGTDELASGTSLFTALITISSDTSVTWSLVMQESGGARIEGQYKAVLSDGKREIFILPVSSNRNGEDSRSIPALGYELSETGKALAAMQYYGGGMLGNNKNIIWIDNGLDEPMKLVLAAALTALLQVKVNSMSE
jgi:hypothetical protein